MGCESAREVHGCHVSLCGELERPGPFRIGRRPRFEDAPLQNGRLTLEARGRKHVALVVHDANGVAGDVIDVAASVSGAVRQQMFGENLEGAGEGQTRDRGDKDARDEGSDAGMVGRAPLRGFLGEKRGQRQAKEQSGDVNLAKGTRRESPPLRIRERETLAVSMPQNRQPAEAIRGLPVDW